MEYELKIDNEFSKDFKRLDKSIRDQAWKKIKKLKKNPKAGKPLKYLNLWELRAQMYRIFYAIEDNKIEILLLAAKHKDEVDMYVRGLTTEQIRQRFLNYGA